jgi:VWFA-related protein
MMRKLLLFFLLVQVAPSAIAAKRITVAQLERFVAENHAKSDVKIAPHFFDLELTERLSAAKLAALEAALPGPESRRSLVALADQAAFLDPPPAEIPTAAAPDPDTQRRMMAAAVDYAAKTMHQLPNLFATRDTIHFEDSPAVQKDTGEENVSGTFTPYQPLHPVSRSTLAVQYRDGQEVVDANSAQTDSSSLTSKGEFGPILATVLGDAPQGNLTWSHWEQGPTGLLAVFRFAVPRSNSHYQVEFCCIDGSTFRRFSGYHGELTLDPAAGTILRLTLIADLAKSDPVVKADIMVEYGSVELGDRTYICPIKSVSIFLAPEPLPGVTRITGRAGGISQRPTDVEHQDLHSAPLQTMLNEVVFDEYHLFRADAHILTADNAASTASQPPERTTPSASPVSVPQPKTLAEENHAAAAPVETPAAAQPAPNTAVLSAPTVAPTVPEMTIAKTTTLPDVPVAPAPPPPGSNFTLRVSTRLVDVGVAAYDKSGHPITGLRPEDFEIDDNGRKQTVRFFSEAASSSETPANSPGPSGVLPEEPVYSNRLGAPDNAHSPETAAPGGSSTILLLDARSLALSDLTLARRQMLKFVAELPPNERVGFYVRVSQGFKVVVEETRDHAALASALRQWMPEATDLARAQDEEQRNRQQFDDVHNPSDMQYVNGNAAGGGATPPPNMVDPKLMNQGDHPGRDALTLLVGVAAHLAQTPGHKNLVWIASDNVLADWTDHAAGSDQGRTSVDAFALRAQEALNDAHVSVYPLDASQLETNTIDPSLQNPNVELEAPVKDVTPTASLGDAAPGARPGRITAEMQQDLHPIQIAVQQMAQATGGRIFRRSGNMVAALNSVIEDGRAAYLLSFAPDSPPDDQYHRLTVRVAAPRGVTLRYRTGYLYAKEPATLKDRFELAIWQPLDATEIAISAHLGAASSGAALALRIAATDVSLTQQGDRWIGKLDIFLVQRDDTGIHARVNGQSLVLRLKPATYQELLNDGIPFDQFVGEEQGTGTLRIIVVDENSGRIGSITLPASILKAAAG